MTLIVVVDNNGGLVFSNRRLSRDKFLIERILEITSMGRLYVNNYTASLFDEKDKILITDKPQDSAGQNDFAFIENIPIKNNFNRIIVYCWNRDYPSDVKLDLNLKELELVRETEFKGCSHEKITERIYLKK